MRSRIPRMLMNAASRGSWKRAADGAEIAGPGDLFWILSPAGGGWLRETLSFSSQGAKNYSCRMGHTMGSSPGPPPLPA